MKLSEVKELIDANYLYMVENDPEITCCMGADMMSDVLAFSEPNALLITGLTNAQSVRTADFADAVAIVYIRGKLPEEQTIELARELNIPLMATELSMFAVCGVLNKAGLRGIC